MSGGNTVEYSRLMNKDVSTWGVSEVGMWLDFINLSNYKISFIENCVTGTELPDLGVEDLVMLGVKSLGHRKRLQKEIANIRSKSRGNDGYDSDNDSTGSSSSHASENSSASSASRKSESTYSYGPNDRVRVKFAWKGDISVAYVHADISRRKLLRKARKECRGVRVELMYKDAEGDKINLKKDNDIQSMFRHMKPPIRLECKVSSSRSSSRAERSDDAIPASETAVLDTLNDAAVIIDAHCTIRYMNAAGLKMWDYPRSEVIGQNVKMLMSAAYAGRHDQIVERYVQGITTAKVIGKGARQVMGKNSHGDPFPMKLSLTETKEKGRHTFTGTCVRSDIGGDAGYSALDSLLESAIVISEKGNLLYLNTQACELFGYKKEHVLGQNVKMLMPSPYRENHDFYLANYLKTGVKQVIGKTRHVLAEKADGSVVPITLAVCQKKDEATGKYIFTGMVRVREGHNPGGGTISVLKQEREVVNGLMVPGVIINEQCEVQAFNRAASKLLGYDLSEVLGNNVKMIVPPAHSAKHDSYVSNYLQTGVAKVIGKERILAARRKDGKLIKIQLSVTEKADGDKKIFTGMFHGV